MVGLMPNLEILSILLKPLGRQHFSNSHAARGERPGYVTMSASSGARP